MHPLQKKSSHVSALVSFFALISLLMVACGTNNTTMAANKIAIITTKAVDNSIQTQRDTTSLTSLRMLNATEGWALSASSILKTADGGQHWHNVTPADTQLGQLSKGDFLNASSAWIATSPAWDTPQSAVTLLHTSDGGQHWQKTSITQSAVLDVPHFINAHEGWLEVENDHGTGAISISIYHSSDGGQSWSKLADNHAANGGTSVNGLPAIGTMYIGLAFQDSLHGWATAAYPRNSGVTDNLILYASSDGGHNWHEQSMPTLPTISGGDYAATAPVISGNDGLLPVTIFGNNKLDGVDLYVTHNGGKSWQPTTLATTIGNFVNQIAAADLQHIWISDSNGQLTVTHDGGQHWHTLSTHLIKGEMSFIDANTGWAIGDHTLLHSSDGGITWTQLQYTIQ